MSKRKGKIAQLPYELREEVNLMLRDGKTGQKICDFLATKDYDVNEQNVSAWYQGGFNDWLQQQDRIADIKVRRDASLAMVQAITADRKTSLVEANELTLAAQVQEVLQDMDTSVLKNLMSEDPAQFFKLAKTIISQTNERTKRDKLEFEFQKYRESVEENKKKILALTTKAKNKGGLTKETLQQIEEQAALL